jgi:thiopurine S-methyltransferase
MDASFWHAKWAMNEIGFHGSEANPFLVRHFSELAVPPGGRLFLPLCGKTLDIHWLLAQGHRVAGAELSPVAIEQLFSELGVAPQVTQLGALSRYSGPDIDIFVGDFFDLSAELLGPVDAVYDRAALVALPAAMRARYAAHLMEVTGHAPQLLVCFDYDQRLHEGPPFAVPALEVAQHYEGAFKVIRLASVALPGGLKGKCVAQEDVWLLTKPEPGM